MKLTRTVLDVVVDPPLNHRLDSWCSPDAPPASWPSAPQGVVSRDVAREGGQVPKGGVFTSAGKRAFAIVLRPAVWGRWIAVMAMAFVAVPGASSAQTPVATTPVATVIVHGWQPWYDDVTWMSKMAEAISARQGGAPIYPVTIQALFQPTIGAPPVVSFPRGAVITVNWSAVAFVWTPSSEIALTIARLLIANPRLMSMPIHLIGHSRGASVVSAVAELLAEEGAWVDQLTTLDPHPIAFDEPVGKVWRNVIFADNYWRAAAISPIEPEGSPIVGAHDRDLSVQLVGHVDHRR